MQVLQVQTTFDNRQDADRVGLLLVEKRLAACAQICGPIKSVYRWQGKIETADEWLCLINTTPDRYAQVERAISEAHPYETPEILALPAAAGGSAYLHWVRAETEPAA